MNMHEIELAAMRASNHFFDRDTKRFFRSRILPTTYEGPGGIYFVTSEQFHSPTTGYTAQRGYTVRKFEQGERVRESDGRTVSTVKIDTVGDFNVMTRAQAVRMARKLAEG